ncbi:MAG: hypothetical protein E6K29_13410 [Gammaproteobacteria bacterium]|nr:MAG: hypothetical protein E6K29_13410 [Gammaproteobacteria bacterium]
MLSLRNIQSSFAAHLFEDEPGSIIPWIRADGIDPAARLHIYRNNLHEGFQKTLALEYPVIRRLVGNDYFRQLALAFLGCYPSTSGDLHHVGTPFASFLRKRFADTGYPYLADVAALEWAYQECLVAAELDPLDPLTLRDVPAQSYGTLRFTLRPACRLVHSPFPVLRIWEVNQPGVTGDETINLDSGPDFLLLLRNPSGIFFRRIPEDDYRLLAAFTAGKSLDEALEVSLASNPQFDLSAALRRCIEFGVLSQLTFYQSTL